MDGKVVIGTELDTKNFEAQIEQLEDKLDTLEQEYEAALKDAEFPEDELKRYQADIEKTKNKIIQLKKQQEALNKQDFKDLGKSITNITNKVAKWSLAIFGVRSAYMAIRSAINTIAEDDEQLAADIEYIKDTLAYALEPVVRAVVSLVKELLYMIAYIIKMWTGYNIFENANKSLKNSNKQAKELRKTLAGFDEMNIINEDGSTGTLGATMPSMDFSDLDTWETKVNKFVEDVINKWYELGNEMQEALNNPQMFTETFGNWGQLVYGIVQMFKGLWDTISGLVEQIGGILDIIVGIFTGDIELIKQGFNHFIEGGKKILTGLLNFIFGIFNTIKGFINGVLNTLWDITKSIFKGIINFIISGINKLIGALNKISFDTPSWIPLIGGKHFGFNIPKIPKLAQGGIVNNPGPGVMMGSYIAGEKGPEAVLPLTDDTLQRLANMIPITVNVTNTMNGRVISREIQKVQNDSNFAYNR